MRLQVIRRATQIGVSAACAEAGISRTLFLSVAVSPQPFRGRQLASASAAGATRAPASTVQRLLRRHGLATRRHRLLVLEHHSARDAGLLTQRTRQLLWRRRHGETRHVEAERPGELLCLDTFYIGKLKGVGKVWQVTACDVASSYGVARTSVTGRGVGRLAAGSSYAGRET
jgi:transposase InsO family protein